MKPNFEKYTLDAEELLACMREHIKEKYNITNPTFVFSDSSKPKDDNALILWINTKIYMQSHRWVQYKKLKGNAFLIKEYFAATPHKRCLEIVEKAIADAKESVCDSQKRLIVEQPAITTSNKILYRIGDILYSEGETHQEALTRVKGGSSTIWNQDPIFNQGRNAWIVPFEFAGPDEYGRAIPNGEIILEKI